MKIILSLLICFFIAPPAFSCADNNENHILNVQLHATLRLNNTQKSGSVLYSETRNLSELTHNNSNLSCADSSDILLVSGLLTGSESGRGVYPTAIEGVGVRIYYGVNYHDSYRSLKKLPFHDGMPVYKNQPLKTKDVTLKIELVRTVGEIKTHGVLQFHQQALLNFHTKELNNIINLHISTALPAPVCNVQLPQLIVHLPSTKLASIGDKKSLPNDQALIPLTLDCNSTLHLISLTLNGDAFNSLAGILNIEKTEGAARGVGVQFWYKRRIIPVNIPFVIMGRELDNAETGTFLIPLQANYIKIAPVVSAGKVNVAATLHFNYL
ncbi:fimbrial protein [Buttiauxella sp. S19-1]|uniref:fimbrial protein n=1 Tax=Buttiauxella sp. S19-1 TaxID=941430 RepID=UPI001EDA68A3|nr:fimbrial protein [Buttiauxella sp. S19-1]